MYYRFNQAIQSAVFALLMSLAIFAAYHQTIKPLQLSWLVYIAFTGCTACIFSLLLYLRGVGRQDRVTKGTKLVSPKEFNRYIKGDGLAIPCRVKPFILLRWLPWQSEKQTPLPIRKSDETVHVLIAGDSGTGKSALQHTFLQQIGDRSEDRSVVYDPSLEFWEHHGCSSRGDLLLHPLEDTCPYWNIIAEIRNPLDAAALAKSLIPDTTEGKIDFWDFAPRQLLAQLLLELKKQQKGTRTLIKWLADPELIFDLVAGTEVEVLIDKNAHGQRAGILASLSRIADAIKLLPPDDGRPKFSFTEWSKQGRGWLFIGTKGVGERDGLRPLISAWLDTAFARLMEHKNGIPTWVVVDELPSLQKLPSLKVSLHEGRKYNLRFVLGFQGRAQIEQLYGRDAETLMSAPSTRIFLRSNEYAAAEWAAKNIGMPERERQMESFTSPLALTGGGKDSINVRTDKRTDYLVFPNEIQNLPKLTGYLRYDNYAVPISFPYPEFRSSRNEQVQVSAIRQLQAQSEAGEALYSVLGVSVLSLLGYCYKSIYLNGISPHWSIKLTLLLLLGYVSYCLSSDRSQARNACQGADGEERIFTLLRERLGNRGWSFEFNRMLADNWDVDVIAKSPSGRAFIIDVKSHRGTKVVTKDGLIRRYGKKEYQFNKCFLTSAKSQAVTVAKRFNYDWVTPIVCFVDGEIEYRDGIMNPKEVAVVGGCDLVDGLEYIESSLGLDKLSLE